MSGHHPETDGEREFPIYPALNRLERRPELWPAKYGREPFWHAPVVVPTEKIHVPSWNWTAPLDVPAGADVLTLDANGAYLAAIGSVTIAHAHLSHTGAVEEPIGPKEVLPGYYKIREIYWGLDDRIVSPMGEDPTTREVWIAHPTLILLLELLDQGVIGGLDITDSWTSRVKTDFLKWAAHMRNVRRDIMDRRDAAETGPARQLMDDKYEAFKEGYSVALSMMKTGKGCNTCRPDWATAVYAQHAANTWRKAWKYTATGRPLVRMGSTDEISILAADLPAVMSRPQPPFRVDETGRALGAMKTKHDKPAKARTRPGTPALEDIEGDIL